MPSNKCDLPTPTARRNRFAYFGQMTPFKGVHVLIDAVSRVPEEIWGDDSTLMIFGGNLERQPTEYQDRVAKLIEDAGRRVRFYGAYQNQDMPRLMRSVDWVVMPSVWWENSPVVIQEALHHGVLEDLQELLPVGLRRGPPVAADDELADLRHVEVLVEELTEVTLLLLGAHRGVTKARGRLLLQIGEKGGRLAAVDGGRGGLQPERADQRQGKEPAHAPIYCPGACCAVPRLLPLAPGCAAPPSRRSPRRAARRAARRK